MKILYLDQNKWIDLARANSNSQRNYSHSLALAKIQELVELGKLIVPLTASNIYETQKINDLSRRKSVASVQSVLSRGIVFRCGSSRLGQELAVFLNNLKESNSAPLNENWYLSDFFLDAFAERSEWQHAGVNAKLAFSLNQMNSVATLYSYLIDLPDEERKQAVKNYSASSIEQIKRIEERKKRLDGQDFSTHRRTYQCELMIEHLDQILMIAQGIGFEWRQVSDIGSIILKRLVEELSYFSTETDLAVKLERSPHKLNENDLRDMLSICAVVPYSNYAVIEKAFASLAIQAKLESKFETKIFTNLSDLNTIL